VTLTNVLNLGSIITNVTNVYETNIYHGEKGTASKNENENENDRRRGKAESIGRKLSDLKKNTNKRKNVIQVPVKREVIRRVITLMKYVIIHLVVIY